MNDNGVASATSIPGFLVECLVSNGPNGYFGYNTYSADIREVLIFLLNNTMTDENCEEWVEVSGLKWLFHSQQPWTRVQSHKFIHDVEIASWYVNRLGANYLGRPPVDARRSAKLGIYLALWFGCFNTCPHNRDFRALGLDLEISSRNGS